jgi:hypothetical protein
MTIKQSGSLAIDDILAEPQNYGGDLAKYDGVPWFTDDNRTGTFNKHPSGPNQLPLAFSSFYGKRFNPPRVAGPGIRTITSGQSGGSPNTNYGPGPQWNVAAALNYPSYGRWVCIAAYHGAPFVQIGGGNDYAYASPNQVVEMYVQIGVPANVSRPNSINFNYGIVSAYNIETNNNGGKYGYRFYADLEWDGSSACTIHRSMGYNYIGTHGGTVGLCSAIVVDAFPVVGQHALAGTGTFTGYRSGGGYEYTAYGIFTGLGYDAYQAATGMPATRL